MAKGGISTSTFILPPGLDAERQEEFNKAVTKSRKLFDRARKILVGGVNSPVRAFRAVGGHPRFAVKGSGSLVFDADGRSYVDYCLSWGPLILGHARKEIVAAARRALERGSTFGMPTEGEVELAERLSGAIPSLERVRL